MPRADEVAQRAAEDVRQHRSPVRALVVVKTSYGPHGRTSFYVAEERAEIQAMLLDELPFMVLHEVVGVTNLEEIIVSKTDFARAVKP